MRTIALALGLGVLVSSATAEVVRFELTTPPRPALGGASFGSTGPYEEIRGSATIALDPADPRNAVISDLDRAPLQRAWPAADSPSRSKSWVRETEPATSARSPATCRAIRTAASLIASVWAPYPARVSFSRVPKKVRGL